MATNKTKIIFDEEGKDFVLGIFDKTIDKEGFIIEKSTKRRVITPEGREITKKELAVINKGS